jgi:hypothetical protein
MKFAALLMQGAMERMAEPSASPDSQPRRERRPRVPSRTLLSTPLVAAVRRVRTVGTRRPLVPDR